MPELPEVETVRRGLEKLILGKTIQSVEVKYPKMIQTDRDAFRQDLPGQEMKNMVGIIKANKPPPNRSTIIP